MMISDLGFLHLNSAGTINRASELLNLVKDIKPGELALASELCVSGYENLGDEFESELIANLKNVLPTEAFFGFTHFSNGFNEFVLLNGDKEIYKQKKAVLFTPNLEKDKFKVGKVEDINLFEICGVKIGVLICFELRFTELWEKLKGADIILVPSLWGKGRKRHFEVLCEALALQNRCYVIACSDKDLKFGAVFKPNGDIVKSSKFEPNLASEFKKSLGIIE
ncbi:nitrilase/cyanide hydratase and apolipoprotein N-acyltransferase [Campylobacter hyointestinalis subsp. hyointestinalis]|nr:nitrilase/cyanide hydratase and apolipoprotein N-acyltransferase [Campylobacter hyointestinalis subsp. hyointestinalis]